MGKNGNDSEPLPIRILRRHDDFPLPSVGIDGVASRRTPHGAQQILLRLLASMLDRVK
jgi:hypothetical protein